MGIDKLKVDQRQAALLVGLLLPRDGAIPGVNIVQLMQQHELHNVYTWDCSICQKYLKRIVGKGVVNDSTLAWVHGCISAVDVRHIGEPDLEFTFCTPDCKVICSVLNASKF